MPNFILAFIPAEIHADTLNTMTAFAVRSSPSFYLFIHRLCQPAIQTGGLLSDVFLHLVPHSFTGEHQGAGVHFIMVEEKRNILIGCAISLLSFPYH